MTLDSWSPGPADASTTEESEKDDPDAGVISDEELQRELCGKALAVPLAAGSSGDRLEGHEVPFVQEQ